MSRGPVNVINSIQHMDTLNQGNRMQPAQHNLDNYFDLEESIFSTFVKVAWKIFYLLQLNLCHFGNSGIPHSPW